MEIELIKSEVEHARFLADHLRLEDLRELTYVTDSDPYEVIYDSIETSDKCFTIMIDGFPAVVFGVRGVTVASLNATVWMLSTDDIHKVGFRFLRHCKEMMIVLMGSRTKLFNYVWEGNKLSIKWLKWIGFTIHDPIRYGLKGKAFHYFDMVK